MLDETVQKWPKAWEVRGRQEGLREGEMRTLLRIIQRRFGASVPDWVHARLARSDLATLEGWTEKALDSETLEDIFQ